MSGVPRGAKRPLARPLDGGVRCLRPVHDCILVAEAPRCCLRGRTRRRDTARGFGAAVLRRAARSTKTQFQRKHSFQRRKLGQRNEHPNGPRKTWSSLDVTGGFEGHDHLVDSWSGDAEESLNVCFGWRTAVYLAVVEDEGEVLTLTGRECAGH